MKITTTILALLMPLLMMAETTTDRLAISSATLQPGGSEVSVTVSIEGSRLYTGYEMDLTLPQGVEIGMNNGSLKVSMYKRGGTMYPSDYNWEDELVYTHSITISYDVVAPRTLRVTCMSSENEKFTSTSGKILTISLKATAFAKPGDVALALSNCKLITHDGSTMTTTGYVPEQKEVSGITVGTTATASVSVSATAQWGTLMLPFATTLPEGVQAYSCSSNDTQNLILNPASQVEAYKPYIIYSENGCSETLTGTINALDYPETDIVTCGYLNASVASQTLTEGYVLQKQNDIVQFYKVNSEKPVAVQPGKCWVTIPAALSAKGGFGFTIDNSTAVSEVSATATDNSRYYGIDGIEVRQMQKGRIYISNGKKFIR